MNLFYPYNRGALYTALIVLYSLTAGIAGYVASSYYKQVQMQRCGNGERQSLLGRPKTVFRDENRCHALTDQAVAHHTQSMGGKYQATA